MMTRNISIWKQLEIDNSDKKIHKHALYFYNIGNTDFIHFLYNTMNDTIQFIMFAVYRLHLWTKMRYIVCNKAINYYKFVIIDMK